MVWSELIGKKIAAFRGYRKDAKHRLPWQNEVPISFILFDDKETILEFHEQDQYDYHDCNNSARTLHLQQDAKLWKRMFDLDGFAEATNLEKLHDPF